MLLKTRATTLSDKYLPLQQLNNASKLIKGRIQRGSVRGSPSRLRRLPTSSAYFAKRPHLLQGNIEERRRCDVEDSSRNARRNDVRTCSPEPRNISRAPEV